MKTNRQQLKQIMIDNDLKQADIAELLSVSHWTVKSWTLPLTSKAYRPMPGNMLELLTLKLGR